MLHKFHLGRVWGGSKDKRGEKDLGRLELMIERAPVHVGFYFQGSKRFARFGLTLYWNQRHNSRSNLAVAVGVQIRWNLVDYYITEGGVLNLAHEW
jgi:hypothetical protein